MLSEPTDAWSARRTTTTLLLGAILVVLAAGFIVVGRVGLRTVQAFSTVARPRPVRRGCARLRAARPNGVNANGSVSGTDSSGRADSRPKTMTASPDTIKRSWHWTTWKASRRSNHSDREHPVGHSDPNQSGAPKPTAAPSLVGSRCESAALRPVRSVAMKRRGSPRDGGRTALLSPHSSEGMDAIRDVEPADCFTDWESDA